MIKFSYISIIIVSFLGASCLSGKEISVFGAGEIDSANPYGLTKAEKAALANSEKVNTLQLKLDALELKNEELLLQLEGIKSLYESDSKTINNTKLNLRTNQNKFEEQTIILNEKIEKNVQKLDLLEKKLDTFISLQKENNKLIEESNSKLLTIINKINSEYVKKLEFEELVNFINKTPPKNILKEPSKESSKDEIAVKKEVNSTPISKVSTNDKKEEVLKKQENKKLFDEAISLYKKNMITKALPLFEELILGKYKLSESYFYLGEIKFRKKQYQEAIQFYKQSMIADDKADYIPQLLLHSAESFENMKEKENALKFYKTIVEVYPKTEEAKEAKKKLKHEEASQIKNDTKKKKVESKKTTNKKEETKKSKSTKEKKDDKK